MCSGHLWGRQQEGTKPSHCTCFQSVNFIPIVRDHRVPILVPMGFTLGCDLDRKDDKKLSVFRNKSLLFKRELRSNEEVTQK
ncbi:NADH dehydrogenase [ubiquinone] 1 beta subcomplex subunit 1-like [Myotis daubentonii]|uniref:NADH dehydrogenase [ubiquinone] 1 beta subcomplex subunit 1-like n=1 Tax=Myotis daubentonii TaxID=98922 RepID=UPI002872E115|nr:NADH dehydrogenase [ubiquinone] 1 beta subcomplex subunit 1-like [Myotis daubentonii]